MHRLPRFAFALTLVLLFLVMATPRHAEASEPAGWGRANVSWMSAQGANSYNIYFKEAGEKTYTHSARNLSGSTSTFTIDYLKKGITYWYTVSAVNTSGKEFWWSGNKKFWAGSTVMANSQTVVGSPATTPTTSVGNMSASGSGTASWQKQPNAEFYNVYYREAGEKGYSYSVPHVPTNGTKVTINALKKGIGYYYNVAAYYNGQEHWMGEKVLVWPVEVVYINNPSYASIPQEKVIMPPPVTGNTRDPFATDSLDVLPPPVTSAPGY